MTKKIRAVEKDKNEDYVFHFKDNNKWVSKRILKEDYKKLTNIDYDLTLTYDQLEPYFKQIIRKI